MRSEAGWGRGHKWAGQWGGWDAAGGLAAAGFGARWPELGGQAMQELGRVWPAAAGDAGLLELGDTLGGDAVSAGDRGGQATSLNVPASEWGPGTDCKAHIISRHVVTYQAWFSLCAGSSFGLDPVNSYSTIRALAPFHPSYLNAPANVRPRYLSTVHLSIP